MRTPPVLKSDAPVFLGVIGFCLTIGVLLDRIDQTRLAQQARDAAARTGIEVLQTVTARFTTMALGLGRLVTVAEMVPDLTPQAFDRIAQRLILDLDAAAGGRTLSDPGLLTISIAPDLVVTHVYPADANRALLGADYRALPAQLPDIEAALAAPTPHVSRPFRAVQGHRAIAVRQRIMSEAGTVAGVASVSIDLGGFTDQLARQFRAQTGYRIGFVVNGSGGLGDADVFRMAPLVLDLASRDLGWSIALLPAQGWPSLPLLTPTRAGVALVTLLLLALTHVITRRSAGQRKHRRRLEKGIDALSSGFVIFDRHDRLIHWNDTYEQMFDYGTALHKGVTLQELLRSGLKKGIFRVTAGSERDWITRNVDNHRRAGGAVEVEMADGRWIRVLSRRTEDGDLVGVRFDITDLKRAQHKAESLSRAKSEMISVMSHELRTPLTTILGFGRLLTASPPRSDDPHKDAFATDAVNRIVAAGDHLLGLINEMLDYVNLGTAARQPPATGCNLQDVIRQGAERIRTRAAEKGVTLTVTAPDGDLDPDVAADPDRLARILDHLLSNAVKFTPTGGTVRVTTRQDRTAVQITVTDDGQGIPQDKHAAIFDAFSQLAPSGQRREGGIGLGLAMTKRLVELQGGRISVHSTPGQGSSFTVSLPRPQRQHQVA